ncbi:hypothetical protein HYX03_04650 [Candidatus Woesearchaeota archaeon]|nr:hypothetical protein [Candidatus Woesearchaeota archaeon]
MNKNRIFDRVELGLLSTLFDYIAPFINKKINTKIKPTGQNQKISNLENIVNKKPKIGFNDLKELESLLLKNLGDNVKSNKSFGVNSNNFFYSLNMRRQKNSKEKSSNYSISIKYEENQTEEKLKVSVKKSEKEIYSAEIIDKKDAKDRVVPYSISISYEDRYAEERLAITYKQQLKNYMHQHIQSKEDMSERVPLKWLNILPESMMGGVLGFTYLGENFMGRRADLTGKTARMVDIHESIHTPDEYETRILTSWIMEKTKGKYVK